LEFVRQRDERVAAVELRAERDAGVAVAAALAGQLERADMRPRKAAPS